MAPKPLPSQTALRQMLDYDARTGVLSWRCHPRYPSLKGHPALSFVEPATGYCRGKILGNQRLAHRVIWKWLTGEEPPEIDHKNRQRADNRKRNLRASTSSLNKRNVRMRDQNSSGFCGVRWCSQRGGWKAHIKVNRRNMHLGYFDDFDLACEARRAANVKYGFDPSHGRRQAKGRKA